MPFSSPASFNFTTEWLTFGTGVTSSSAWSAALLGSIWLFVSPDSRLHLWRKSSTPSLVFSRGRPGRRSLRWSAPCWPRAPPVCFAASSDNLIGPCGLLRVLQVPLCLLLADRLHALGKGEALRAAGLRAARLPAEQRAHRRRWYLEWACPLFFLPLVVLALRGLERQPRRPDWLIRSLAVALTLGELSWCFYRESLCTSVGWSDAARIIMIRSMPYGYCCIASASFLGCC